MPTPSQRSAGGIFWSPSLHHGRTLLKSIGGIQLTCNRVAVPTNTPPPTAMVLITPAPEEAGDPSSPDKKKKSKLVTSSQDAARRLIEYCVVVSSVRKNTQQDEEEQQALDTSGDWGEDDVVYDDYDFTPVITARYPLEDHADNPLHESTTFFCHPSGIGLRSEPSMPKIHYFVATGGTGRQMYGVCLTLWEPYMISGHRLSPTKVKEETQLEVYLPKCVVLLSMYPYLIAFREFLTQLNRLSKMGEMTLPLERYIANFCAEIPAPPPGSFEVQTTILDSVIKIWSPPHNQPIAWVSLPFSHLFECLDIDNIILVWHCLALERQVLLTSTQMSLLTECAEIFLSMLFPMRWSHAYIPVLPHFLIPILSAPMPFLCGIGKGNLADALCDLSRECVVVDLDKNLVTLGPDTEALPPLPPQLKSALYAKLNDNVGMVFREARSLRKTDDYSGSGEKLQPHVKLMADAMWEGRLCLFDEAFHLFFTPEESRKNLLNGNDTSGMDTSERDGVPVHIITTQEKQNMRKQSTWDAVQEAFLDSYVYLLRNYRKFLVFPSKDNEGSYGGAGFRSKEFVQSQRYDMQPFLEELIGTQVYDNFITKRLYGSGEADVTFFDQAVDKFLKSQGLLSSGGRMLQGWRGGGAGAPNAAQKPSAPGEGPLLQSARVHRKLKTIVPPEPSAEGLPPHPLAEQTQQDGGPVVTKMALEDASEITDDMSVNSLSSYGTQSTSRSNRTSPKKSIQDKAAEILDKHSKYRYTYETFPSEFDSDLFGEPRPLSSAVVAEFDRQKKAAAQFRRKKSSKKPNEKTKLSRAPNTQDAEIPPSAEVASFTLFFMAFSAVVGKELLEISDNPLLAQDKTILATYNHPENDSDYESELSEGDSVPTTIATSTGNDDEFEDALDNASLASHDNEDFVDSKEEAEPVKQKKAKMPRDPNKPRSRFQDSLSALQIEEAKATGRAQLALAFEMLTMMKKRGLKADPEAYQCLIDACGRVGDTKRATELLAKMHEDGIVADGVVYSCLVSAFSAESAWKKSSGEAEEDLPEWANSTAVEMDWNKLHQKTTFMASAKQQLAVLAGKSVDEEEDDADSVGSGTTPYYYNKLRKLVARKKEVRRNLVAAPSIKTLDNMSFFITEAVEVQIELGENLLEIVYPDISVDTDNETCPRCNFLLSDDDVVAGWTPNDSQDYATSCPNCTQRFVPHFHVQSTSPTFMGSRGPASPLFCERLSPWVLQKEIRTVMSDREGIENLLSPEWVEAENKNAVLWWNLVLSCMRYRFPFTFLLQGSFEQNLIAPMPEHDD